MRVSRQRFLSFIFGDDRSEGSMIGCAECSLGRRGRVNNVIDCADVSKNVTHVPRLRELEKNVTTRVTHCCGSGSGSGHPHVNELARDKYDRQQVTGYNDAPPKLLTPPLRLPPMQAHKVIPIPHDVDFKKQSFQVPRTKRPGQTGTPSFSSSDLRPYPTRKFPFFSAHYRNGVPIPSCCSLLCV
jgi:hypothetical protein